jgi:hypothetical protein
MEHLNIPLPEDEAPYAPANKAVKPIYQPGGLGFVTAQVSCRLRNIANEEFRFYPGIHATRRMVSALFVWKGVGTGQPYHQKNW